MTGPETNPDALPIGETLRSSQTEYRVIDVLGHGGFGITYLARDERTGQRRAIKEFFPRQFATRRGSAVLAMSDDADMREMLDKNYRDFWREGEILQNLMHDNVVRVFDAFEANNTAYMVMEFIDGDNLAHRLNIAQRSREPLEWDEFRAICLGILNGLERVHAIKQMHRDVKPSNIMLRASNGTPVLIDFGSAREFNADRSQPLTQLVTPGYSAPEVRFGQGTFASDVYSAAVVIHECLSLSPRRDNERLLDLHKSGKLKLSPSFEATLGGRAGVLEFLRSVDEGTLDNIAARPNSVALFREMLFPSNPAGRRERGARYDDPSPQSGRSTFRIHHREDDEDSSRAGSQRSRLALAALVGLPSIVLIGAVAAIVLIGPSTVVGRLEEIVSDLSGSAAPSADRPAASAAEAYEQARRADTPGAYNQFLSDWGSDPTAAGPVAAAQARIAELHTEAERALSQLGPNASPAALTNFRRNAKHQSHWAEADARLSTLRAIEERQYQEARARGTQAALNDFLARPSTFFFRATAETRAGELRAADEQAWTRAETGGLCEVDQYLDPANPHYESQREAANLRRSQLVAEDQALWSPIRQSQSSQDARDYLARQACGRFRADAERISSSPGVAGASAPGATTPAAGGSLSWARVPTEQELVAAFPARARLERIGGSAVLSCTVLSNLSTTCVLLSESPSEYGFGAAAIEATRVLRANANLSSGAPAAGTSARVTVRFRVDSLGTTDVR